MKSVILIRHAKSDWNNPLQKDFDRPLNERGNRDAPAMAKRLIERLPHVDLFVSSPAKRALTTARYFAGVYGVKSENILQKPELYHASAEVFYEVIEEMDNRCNTIVLFSHNVGITDFVNNVTAVKVGVMPTCALFGLNVAIENWEDFRTKEKTFWFFDYPKKAG